MLDAQACEMEVTPATQPKCGSNINDEKKNNPATAIKLPITTLAH
jgi:hypothetical protein